MTPQMSTPNTKNTVPKYDSPKKELSVLGELIIELGKGDTKWTQAICGARK